ncbi:MAG: serine hydrolase, partial [Chitinophagaceae bacterium]
MKKASVSVLFLLAALTLTNGLTYFVASRQSKDCGDLSADLSALNASNSPDTNEPGCRYNIVRLSGYKYIHPLMYAEPVCESDYLSPIKRDIESIITSYKVSGVIRSASVYLREFNNGEWITIDDQKRYSPGSLLKVPELITFIKMNESRPGLLDSRIVYDRPLVTNKTSTYVSKSIQLGKSYTIRELLHYMIAYSDNNATYLLNQFMDIPTFKKVFTDLGLKEPDMTAAEYGITAKEYSTFMKVLYNGSYLSLKDSEYCTELLSECDFKKGLVAGLPPECKIAHKFGEGGTSSNMHLGESGLIFANRSTYLLTVMTSGSEMEQLPQVIEAISKAVYSKMANHGTRK